LLRKNFEGRKTARAESAKERQSAYDELSTSEKLDRLDRFIARKQRARLESMLRKEAETRSELAWASYSI